MIDPDYFGCSGKLSYGETMELAFANDRVPPPSDYSDFGDEGHIVSSLDRVHRCSKRWASFARIALNHAFGDVICAGAIPVQAMLSFEFGIDAPASERVKCSEAFAVELAARGIELGKCHSSYNGGVTAVTIATLAKAPSSRSPKLTSGSLYLSRPIGAFKLHYLREMGVEVSREDISDILEAPHEESFHRMPWSHMTDVSGHGLLGAAGLAAKLYGLHLSLEITTGLAISDEIFSIPVECLQNPLGSYGMSFLDCDDRAVTVVTLKETAGPYITFVEDRAPMEGFAASSGLLLGRYRRGSGEVEVSWLG